MKRDGYGLRRGGGRGGLTAAASRLLLALTVLLAASCSRAPAGPPAAPGSPSAATRDGSRVAAAVRMGPRIQDLVIDSSAVGQVRVRVLTPDPSLTRPPGGWPVLYLLHGCCDTYVSWTRSTDIEQLTAHTPLLVVMPDGGPVGFYSDWLRGPAWERFHTVELPALLSARYAAGRRAVVGGVSMGGLGALDYAARHPGAFAAALSFSGVVDTRLSPDESDGYVGLVRSQGQDPSALWGDPRRDARVWSQHNPYDLAPKLRGVRLFVSAGDGRPGPLDPRGAARDPIEGGIGAENRAFVARLRALGLDATLDLYGPGTHHWVYWQRELHRAWPLVTSALAVPAP